MKERLAKVQRAEAVVTKREARVDKEERALAGLMTDKGVYEMDVLALKQREQAVQARLAAVLVREIAVKNCKAATKEAPGGKDGQGEMKGSAVGGMMSVLKERLGYGAGKDDSTYEGYVDLTYEDFSGMKLEADEEEDGEDLGT